MATFKRICRKYKLRRSADIRVDKTDDCTMGNQQSSPADIPVYYKKGYGVSIYKPSDNPNMQIRNRHHVGLDSHTASDTTILKGNLRHSRGRNGLVTPENPATQESEAGARPWVDQELSGVNRGTSQARNIEELQIQVDESGFVDDGIDTHADRLSNSLKGNFSPTSLYEKNRQFSLRSESDIETDGEENVSANVALASNGGDNATGKYANKDLDRLALGTNLSASSVLLTPPSDDDLPSSSHQFMSFSTHCSSHSTNADVSEIHSEIADINSEPLGTDEEREQMSPLPLDKSPRRLREQSFQKKLMLKLGEVSSMGSNQGSANSSSCTSPEHSSDHRRRSLSCGDKDNSISGVSSPELELLNSESTDCPVVNTGTFTTLEDQIHVVEDEFVEISSKLHELSNKYSNQEREPGAEIFKDIFQRYPSIRVRQQERGVRLSSLSENESTQESRDVSMIADEPDLSWDLENVLDMVYSEASDSASMHNNGVVKKLIPVEEKSEQGGTSSTSMSFSSSVEINGSLYEDEFHLQLGSRVLTMGPEPDVANHKSEVKQSQCPVSTAEVTASDQSQQQMDTSVVSSQSETDSASPPVPEETVSPDPPVSTVCNVGPKQLISDYADREWKGETPRAGLMRKAYKDIPNHCKCCHLRRIRGDNYCGIRGVVYQALVNALPPLDTWASKEETLARLTRAFDSPSSGIRQWTFASRLPYTTNTLQEVMVQCITTVYEKFTELQQHSQYSEREDILDRLLNSDPQCDLELMEGVKLLMLLHVVELHRDIEQGNDVPVFAWLLFARDTSKDVASFVANHLNPVGDSGGLEQVEMFLLGASLRVRIQVLRLQQYGEEDFISQYPDDCNPSWPTVTLIAEDDRHYNVPVL